MMKNIMMDFDSLPTYSISDVETLKVISDSLRLDIFLTVRELNRNDILPTVKQISDEMNVPQAKLYYHIKLLENHNFLHVADTRIVSGIVEKLYQVSAQRVTIDDDLFSTDSGKEAAYPVLSNVVSEVLKKIQSILSHPEHIFQDKNIAMSRHILRLSHSQIGEFSEKMGKLMEEYKTENKNLPADELHNYSLFYVLYPEESVRRGQTIDDNH